MKIDDDFYSDFYEELKEKPEPKCVKSLKVVLGMCIAALTVFSAIVLVLIRFTITGQIPTYGDITIMIMSVWLITFCIYAINKITKG